ncbi:sigma-70 family RNA polymerase sigma factor [Pseudonocardia sp. MH-G8]|uniref:sigma-70 family RNA polymerase sigma factor n=1 Tax=Pseudonocardia sp. MH-G8 TaxID=1854588 RepID=UPI001E3095F8|nr:sigma-70 family RNA polymerase sigma factor [Pseudonocardia sp. MH-G8]
MTAPVIEKDALIAAAQRNEPGAVDAPIREVIMPLAWRFCRRYAGGRAPDPAADLDDMVQLVVLAVVGALPSYRTDGGAFEAFVAGIARHKAADAFRGAARNRSVPVADFPEQADRSAGPELSALQAERAALAKRLIATLPERQQQILTLRLIHQLSAAETGAALGMTEGAVRVAQHRALTALRARLAEGT